MLYHRCAGAQTRYDSVTLLESRLQSDLCSKNPARGYVENPRELRGKRPRAEDGSELDFSM